MRENIQIHVDELFNRELVSLTKALAGIELIQAGQENWGNRDTLVETIYTNGDFNSFILVEMEQELFEYIVSMMHGGSPPDEEEKPLYMNEYINIICGRAISVINNERGHKSRLSVPTFHGNSFEESYEKYGTEQTTLIYKTEKGFMRFVICYTFQ